MPLLRTHVANTSLVVLSLCVMACPLDLRLGSTPADSPATDVPPRDDASAPELPLISPLAGFWSGELDDGETTRTVTAEFDENGSPRVYPTWPADATPNVLHPQSIQPGEPYTLLMTRSNTHFHTVTATVVSSMVTLTEITIVLSIYDIFSNNTWYTKRTIDDVITIAATDRGVCVEIYRYLDGRSKELCFRRRHDSILGIVLRERRTRAAVGTIRALPRAAPNHRRSFFYTPL